MPRDDATLLDVLKAVLWKAITGMRDKLIHHYDAVDLEQVRRASA